MSALEECFRNVSELMSHAPKIIGRESALQTVLDCARRRKHLAVFGAEGVGKTALLENAIRELPEAIFCSDTSTLNSACDALLAPLGLPSSLTNKLQRKRAILQTVRGRRLCFFFDHVCWVAPQLLSFLDILRESHTLIIAARSLASADAGHLREILWDFEKLELRNLEEADARKLIRLQIEQRTLELPNPQQFERDVLRLSRGNPRIIVELCEQASKGHYVFGNHLSSSLLDLDRRINQLRIR